MSVLKYFMCCTSLLSLQRSIHFPDVGDCISPNHLSNVHYIDCMIIFTTVTYTLARHLQIHTNLKILHQAGIEPATSGFSGPVLYHCAIDALSTNLIM